jgi:lysophospholipase L1-like esterase
MSRIPKSLIWILPLLIIVLEFSIRLLERGLLDGEVGSLHHYIVTEGDFFYGRPGARVVQPERYGNTVYSINSHGFREREIDVRSPERKVLFLGDSITFGLYVDHAFTYPILLEEIHNRGLPDRPPIKSINLAIFAYAPRQELEALKRTGLKFRPELIVLQLYMNDFRPRVQSSPSRTQVLRQRLYVFKEQVMSRIALLRRGRQAVQMLSYELFHDLRRKYFVDTLNDADPKGKAKMFSRLPDEDIDGFNDVEQISLQAKEANIPLVVMLISQEVQLLTDKFDIINERVNDFCRRKGITFVDPLTSMRKYDEKLRLFCDGSHLSPTGHRFVAEWLFPLLFQGELAGLPRQL